jgi:hypothetical protein
MVEPVAKVVVGVAVAGGTLGAGVAVALAAVALGSGD